MTVRLLPALLALLALAACDSGGAEPGPTPDPSPLPGLTCGEVAQRADTLLIVAGDSASVDLDALFGSQRRALTYAVAPRTPLWAQVEGARVVVRPTTVGVWTVVVSASRACGAPGQATSPTVGRFTLVVSTRAAGVSCDVPPTSRPPAPVRLASGGRAASLALLGAGGLFDGSFNFNATPLAVDGAAALVAASYTNGRLLLTPRGAQGSGTVRVNAQDVCLRRITVDVPVDVIDSPTCSADYTAADVDYLPLTVGRRWRYATATSSGGIGSPPQSAVGEEVWVVTSEGACAGGSRSYGVQVERTGIGASSPMTLTVRGDSVSVGHPEFQGLVRRRYPASTAETVQSVFDGQPQFGSSYSFELRREAGFARLGRYTRQGAGSSSSWSATLMEGATGPTAMRR